MFINGCFWHSHNCGKGRRTPKTNSAFWDEKFTKNRARDAVNIRRLRASGWKVGIIWECELDDPEYVSRKILKLVRKQAR